MIKKSLIAFAAGTAVGAAALALTYNNAPQAAPSVDTAPMAGLDYDPTVSLAPLVEKMGPAVVNVHVAKTVDVQVPQFPGWMFPGMTPQGGSPHQQVQRGLGSGFIISPDGYILTNNHVVDDADEVTVKLADDHEYDAKVIGTDERSDIALVKIDADHDLPYLELGKSADLRVGDRVVAIGNPYGLSHTVTAGIVSGKGRAIGANVYEDYIQTDASINHGNSGGPLFNLSGEVVGINTAILPYAQGIGFAVPIDMVTSVLDELKSHGSVARGWIGVGLQDMDEDLAKQLHVDEDAGVVLRQVYPDTPAHDAGLRAGDVVTKLDGEDVQDSHQLVVEIGEHRPGDKVELQLLRDGKEKTVKVKLGKRPSEDDLAQNRMGSSDDQHEATRAHRVGIAVQEARDLAGVDGEGLVITEVKRGSAADGRLKPGDRIVSVNHRDVKTAKALTAAVDKDDDGALFVVERDGAQVLVVVPFKDEE